MEKLIRLNGNIRDMKRLSMTFLAAALTLGAPQSIAPGTAPVMAAPIQKACPTAEGANKHLNGDMPHVRAKIAAHAPIRILAMGSSSTQGVGASDAAHTYPAQLEAGLKKLMPEQSFTVINKGIGGEVTPDMLARLDAVLADVQPDLVLWQSGANEVLRGENIAAHEAQLAAAIARVQEAGADMVLIDPQYTKAMIAQSGALPMIEQQFNVAAHHNLPVFSRFQQMQNWQEKYNIRFNDYSAADGIHMNDWGYACFAGRLAEALADKLQAAPDPQNTQTTLAFVH